ncbi:Alpha/Beta hydrolase protein [Syncephalis fuscata]|nr:Alpha/Beta hydrolase protein [Syncephalis fuscata]
MKSTSLLKATPFTAVAWLALAGLSLLLLTSSGNKETRSIHHELELEINQKTLLRRSLPDKEAHKVGHLPFESDQTPLAGSYAGHLPVANCTSPSGSSQDCGALFYWYFPTEMPNDDKAPLVIWLQGGPGSSSMVGLFYEHGPVTVSDNNKLIRRTIPWTKSVDMVFVDQPVGTGFSYAMPGIPDDANPNLSPIRFTNTNTPNDNSNAKNVTTSSRPLTLERCHAGGYVTDQQQVGRDFVYFLEQFYKVHPDLQQRELFLAGESYAGKFIPAIAQNILQYNRKSDTTHKIPLSGLVIGNGLTVPEVQVKYNAQLAANFGLLSHSQTQELQQLCDKASELAIKKDYLLSLEAREKMFKLFNEYTSNVNYYDIREKDIPKERARMIKFLSSVEILDALHTNGHQLHSDLAVKDCLASDIMKSVGGLFPELLDNYRILLFQGQFDFRDGPIGSEAWIRQIDWHGRNTFNQATRKPWRTSDKPGGLAGYVTEHDNLSHAIVLNAGHFAPANAPEAVLQMLNRWMHKQSIAA